MRIWALILSIAVILGASPAHTAEWRASGSGFYLKGTTHIMTNLHIVGLAKSVRVSFPEGESYTGIVIVRDANNDIAILTLLGLDFFRVALPWRDEAIKRIPRAYLLLTPKKQRVRDYQ
ncbi:MAG: serine protease [Nitrospinota bacterium]